MEQMRLDRFQLGPLTIHMDLAKRRCRDKVQEEGQSENVIQMSMAEENRHLFSIDQLFQPKDAATGIQQQTGLWNKVAAGVSRCTGVVSSRS